MKKVKSGSDISFNFNVKVTDKTTVDEIIREASDIIKVRFAEYKVEPEESEDERIRKLLVALVTIAPTFSALAFTMKDSTDCLSYLEKQKENPKSADSISEDCTSDANSKDRWHKVTDSLPDNGQLVLAKDCLGNVLLARYDGENWEVNVYDNEDHYCHNSISKWCEIPSEKQKEQKPSFGIYWHKIKKGERLPCRAYVWNPDYEKHHDCFEGRLIANLENILVGGDTWYLPADDVRNLPREGVDELPREQKPAGKQDYSGLTDLERAIHHGFLSAGVENVPVTIIKETANECKRTQTIANENANAEWSEEDEDIRDTIIHDLKRLGGDIANVKPAYKKEIDWLKSIRPSWKPSEEQMNCLCAAVDAAIRKHNESVSGYKPARVLKSLYEQLQRLM